MKAMTLPAMVKPIPKNSPFRNSFQRLSQDMSSITVLPPYDEPSRINRHDNDADDDGDGTDDVDSHSFGGTSAAAIASTSTAISRPVAKPLSMAAPISWLRLRLDSALVFVRNLAR